MTAAPASAQSERARQLFELGVQALEAGNPAQAASYFEQSNSINPRASTLCNLGQAYEQLGRDCDAERAYRQCSLLDTQGSFRDTANTRASVLAPRCRQPAPPDPFVRTQPTGPAYPPPRPTYPPSNGGVRVVELGHGRQPLPGPDHGLAIGGGISLALSIGGLIAGVVLVEQANSLAAMLPPPPASFPEGSQEAAWVDEATAYSYAGIGFYIGAGVVGALGAVLLIVDLAQPGVFGPRYALGPRGLSIQF